MEMKKSLFSFFGPKEFLKRMFHTSLLIIMLALTGFMGVIDIFHIIITLIGLMVSSTFRESFHLINFLYFMGGVIALPFLIFFAIISTNKLIDYDKSF